MIKLNPNKSSNIKSNIARCQILSQLAIRDSPSQIFVLMCENMALHINAEPVDTE